MNLAQSFKTEKNVKLPTVAMFNVLTYVKSLSEKTTFSGNRSMISVEVNGT